MVNDSLYKKLGGRKTLEKVHKSFYDYLYKDARLSFYFRDVDQAIIEKVQTDFMSANFGEESFYMGLMVEDAHQNMFIRREDLEARGKYLKQALVDNNIAPDLIEQWLKIDHAFWHRIEKKDPSECKRRFKTQGLLIP